MSTENDFVNWLRNKGLSESSIKKYQSSISQISTYLIEKSIIDDLMNEDRKLAIYRKRRNQFDLYRISNTKTLTKAIKRYFDNKANREKNERGHGQWSAAANNLIHFFETSLLSESLNVSFPTVFDQSQLNDSVTKLRKLGIHGSPEGNKKPKHKLIKTKSYERDPKVAAWVLENSKGVCEGCLKKAPFIKRKDNSAYLEVHHVRRLARSGRDTIDNAVALCPNCHKEVHFGKNQTSLTRKLRRISQSHR